MREVRKPLVSIIESDPELCDTYALVFTDHEYETRFLLCKDLFSANPTDETILFLLSNTPQVVLFDLCPPFEKYWNWFQALEVMHPTDWKIIPVTTSPQMVSSISNLTPEDMLIKPFDLDVLLEKVASQHPLRRNAVVPAYSLPHTT